MWIWSVYQLTCARADLPKILIPKTLFNPQYRLCLLAYYYYVSEKHVAGLAKQDQGEKGRAGGSTRQEQKESQ